MIISTKHTSCRYKTQDYSDSHVRSHARLHARSEHDKKHTLREELQTLQM